MANKDTQHPWQQIEEQAFHAFREWPLWLVLRERELAQQATGSPSGSRSAAKTGQSIEKSKRHQQCHQGNDYEQKGQQISVIRGDR